MEAGPAGAASSLFPLRPLIESAVEMFSVAGGRAADGAADQRSARSGRDVRGSGSACGRS